MGGCGECWPALPAAGARVPRADGVPVLSAAEVQVLPVDEVLVPPAGGAQVPRVDEVPALSAGGVQVPTAGRAQVPTVGGLPSLPAAGTAGTHALSVAETRGRLRVCQTCRVGSAEAPRWPPPCEGET
ncbi:hypothetical protein GCM10010399_47070 [Dactylosporangium fulvum]